MFPTKQYEDWGVEPPSREKHGTEADRDAAMAGPQVRHEWRQMGSRLFCIACPNEHGTEPRYIDYILQGTDENGLPILKKV